jgi:hypothetical protein
MNAATAWSELCAKPEVVLLRLSNYDDPTSSVTFKDARDRSVIMKPEHELGGFGSGRPTGTADRTRSGGSYPLAGPPGCQGVAVSESSALTPRIEPSPAWRYLEFFTANIRSPNTRRAYARACQRFFAWCDERGLTLMTIRPVDVARHIETRQQTHSAPDVKQQLAAVRMLFDWLITGQVVPLNPAEQQELGIGSAGAWFAPNQGAAHH